MHNAVTTFVLLIRDMCLIFFLSYAGTGCPPTSGQTPLSTLPPQSDGHQTMSTRGSMVSTTSSASKPSSAFVSLAGLIGETPHAKELAMQRVRVNMFM